MARTETVMNKIQSVMMKIWCIITAIVYGVAKVIVSLIRSVKFFVDEVRTC